MQTTLEETDKHKVKLTVEVAPEEFGKDLDRAYRKIANQVRVPGFRKGKVPKKIIDAQVGREAVLEEFLSDSVPVYYRDAVREHDLAPITDPDISLDQVEEGKPLVFTATMEVRPRLALEDYTGIKAERPSTDVSDAEIDELVNRYRDRFAELEVVGRPAGKGDYVVADFRATVHDQEVPEATRPDYLYEVGSGEFADKVDEELEGKRAGEIIKANVTLPDDPRYGDRAGAEVTFQILVKEVKGKKLPPADDDFAKTASEFDTLEEFRADLRDKLHQTKEREAEGIVRDRVLEDLVGRVDVDLPDTLVDEETEHRVVHTRERAERAGMTLEQVLETQGWDELRFRSDARTHAIRAIKADLVLEAVARQEQMEVTAEELGREINALAAAMQRDPKELATQLDSSGQIVSLAGDIIRTKALDYLVEHAEFTSEGKTLKSDQGTVEGSSGPPEQEQAEEGTLS